MGTFRVLSTAAAAAISFRLAHGPFFGAFVAGLGSAGLFCPVLSCSVLSWLPFHQQTQPAHKPTSTLGAPWLKSCIFLLCSCSCSFSFTSCLVSASKCLPARCCCCTSSVAEVVVVVVVVVVNYFPYSLFLLVCFPLLASLSSLLNSLHVCIRSPS